MDCIVDAARLARRLSVEVDRAALWRQLKAFVATFGFNHLTVLKPAPDLPQRLSPSIIYSDAPQGFAAEFDRARFCPDYPLVTRALAALEPISASETSATPLTQAERGVLRHVNDALGLRDGWSVPISCKGALSGVLMFGGREPNM